MSPSLPPLVRLALGTASCPVSLVGDDLDSLRRVALCCGAPPPVPARADKPATLTLQGNGPWRLLGPGSRNAPARSLGELLVRLEQALDDAADLAPAPPLLLHASAVQLADGRAVVLAGSSGAGKSTGAVAMALSGSLWLGDECLPLYLDPPAVEACRRPVALRHDVRPWLEPLFPAPGPDLQNGAGKLFIGADSLPRSAAPGPVPLAALVLLGADAGTLDAGAALRALLPCCHAFQRHAHWAFVGLSELCRSVPTLCLPSAGGPAFPQALRQLLAQVPA